MAVFGAYHAALGEPVFRFDATIDHRAGDGMIDARPGGRG